MERKNFFKILLSKQETKLAAAATPALTSSLKKYKGKWDDEAVIHFL
jgi:hypothetical protein